MRWLLLYLLLAVCTSSAQARTWYVTDSGTGDGSVGSPCNLTSANAWANPGDIVSMAAGTYGEYINPASAGSAAAGKITYIGTTVPGDTTQVAGIYMARDYITVSYVKALALGGTYGLTISAEHDSLDHVAMYDGMPHPTPAGDYFRIVDCTFEADSLHELAFGDESTDKLTGGQTINSTFKLYYTRSGRAAFHCSSTQLLEFTGCQFDITISPTSEGGMWKLYNSSNGKWTDCVWNFTTYRQPTSEGNSSRIRDGSHDNRFLRCKWNWLPTTHPVQFLISSTGSAGYNEAQRNNAWDYCEFRSAAPSQNPLLFWEAGMRHDSLAYCTVISAYAPAIGINGAADSSTIVHNTFVKVCPDTLLGSGWPYFTSGVARVIGGEDWTSAPTKVNDNIFFARDVYADSLKNSYGAAWSTSTTTISTRWGGDFNLWWGELGPDSVIYVDGAPADTATLRSTYSVETNSRFGDPMFVGGTPTVSGCVTFDARLLATSPAIGKGSGGSDIGALAYTAFADSFTVTYHAGGVGGHMSMDSVQTVPFDSCASFIEAIPDLHYHFVSWNDGRTEDWRGSTDCNIRSDTSFAAYFEPDSFTVQYVSGGNGTISGTAYQRVAYLGNSSSVTATPSTGYKFLYWTPGGSTSAARADSAIVSDTTFTALFGPETYKLYYSWGSGGTLACDDGLCFLESGLSRLYQYVDYGHPGTQVRAVPSTGYHFLSWSDSYPDSFRTDTATASVGVTCYFARTWYSLHYSALAGGSVLAAADTLQSVPYGSKGKLVTATPASGYAFYSWSDSLKTATRKDSSVVASVSVSAIFNSIYSPPGAAEIALSGPATASGSNYTVTISNAGGSDLHVYSVKLYHRLWGVLREVSCTATPSTATVGSGSSQDVVLSGITWRWRALPDYRIVVTSDAGTATLDLDYDPC